MKKLPPLSAFILLTALYLGAHLLHHSPPAGDPASMARGLAAQFSPTPAIAGIKEPIGLTTGYRETLSNVRRHLRIHPAIPVTVRQMDNHHYLIMPRYFWPANSAISFAWQGSAAHTILDTGNDREVLVNLSQQTLFAWDNGQLIRTMPVSTGVAPRWSTPSGTYWVYKRVRDDHMVGGNPRSVDHWDVQHVPFAQYFNGAIAIHGAWWNHHFGAPASHGCVQLPTAEGPKGPTHEPPDAEWLWHFTQIGTPVIVTGTTPQPINAPKTPLAYPPDLSAPKPARSAAS